MSEQPSGDWVPPVEPEPGPVQPQAETPAEPELPSEPDLPAAPEMPDVFAQHPEDTTAVATQGTSNETSVMTGSAAASAAKAWHILDKFARAAEAAKADIERFVPPGVLQAAEGDVARMLSGIL